MNRDPSPRRLLAGGRRGILTAAGGLAALSLLLLAVGGLLRHESVSVPAAPAPPTATAGETEAHEQAAGRDPHRPDPQDGSAVTPLGRSVPVSVAVPSLEITSSLEKLGRDRTGAMETPKNTDLAGWYAPGPSPGEQGPAVIAGHVTWNGEPSVFHRLGELRSGDALHVTRTDGTTVMFTVDRVEQYPKNEFPTVEVYRNLDHAGLRLITCGGDYSTQDRRYTDNVVVYASLSRVVT